MAKLDKTKNQVVSEKKIHHIPKLTLASLKDSDVSKMPQINLNAGKGLSIFTDLQILRGNIANVLYFFYQSCQVMSFVVS